MTDQEINDALSDVFGPRKPRLTPADQANIATLEAHRANIERIEREQNTQAAIDYANGLIDPSAGIVAGDGCYYSRQGYPE